MKPAKEVHKEAFIYYDLTLDTPLDQRDIPIPEKLEGEEDYEQLFQHIVSNYYGALNIYRTLYGFRNRQRLLAAIMMALKEMMPAKNPEYITYYPSSIGDIKTSIGNLLLVPIGNYPEKKFAYIRHLQAPINYKH